MCQTGSLKESEEKYIELNEKENTPNQNVCSGA